jgi:fumarate hydratase class II
VPDLIVQAILTISSIMPSKRNPTIAEVVAQVAFAVMGNHATISMAGAAWTFELNVAKLVIIDRILQSIRLIGHCCIVFCKSLPREQVPCLIRRRDCQS